MTTIRRQAHWDMGPVLKLWNGRPITELAIRTGIAHRNFIRWLRGGIPDRSADRVGTALGPGPEAIWPEWYNGQGSPKIVDYVANGTVRDAYLRRQRSLASGAAKQNPSQPRPAQEAAITPQPLPVVPAPFLEPPIARSRGYNDDLVYIFPEWLANSADPPGLPPRKEQASCACSTLDDLGRPVFIGRCGDNCERRPA